MQREGKAKLANYAMAVEKTRGRIIAAATRLFGERPFDLVSFAQVARASGIGIDRVGIWLDKTREQGAALVEVTTFHDRPDIERLSKCPNSPAP
jgi:hypothetical protein